MDQRSCLASVSTKIVKGRAVRTTVLRLAMISLTLLVGTARSFSDERCEYPNVFGQALASPENYVGEFRIALERPDYRSAESVKHHLAYSTVWARLLSTTLAAQTSGRCSALVSISLYPDLRVFLIGKQIPTAGQADPPPCVRALEALLLTWQPEKEVINRTSSEEENLTLGRISNPSGHLIDVSNILTRALHQIYDVGTVMHALVSIEPATFQSLDASSFLDWLRRQRSGSGIRTIPLRFCEPATESASAAGTGAETLPYSKTIPPGTLKLSISSGAPMLARLVRHVVVVGEGPAANFSRSKRPAIEKYCNQRHAFAMETSSAPPVTVTVKILCLRSVRFNAAWTVFYCDPADCTSERLAEIAMAEIAADPDVISLAERITGNELARGPYTINVEVKRE